MNRNRAFAAGATTAVLIALAFGFHQAGSPRLQRMANADEMRLRDLNMISAAVLGHFNSYSKLPQTLAEINGSGPILRLNDPETGTAYEYYPLDERRFELCAVFSTGNQTETRRPPWARAHAAGHQCFTYPP